MPRRHILAAVAALVLGTAVEAQTPSTPTAASSRPELAIGRMAPDFSVPGASRYGLLRDPVRLSELRGKTVVIALFPRARTKG